MSVDFKAWSLMMDLENAVLGESYKYCGRNLG